MRLHTARLILRPWQDHDREPFAAMSLEPTVAAFLPGLETRIASDDWIDRQIAHFQAHGFCLWAAEHRKTGAFVGAIGLTMLPPELPFAPAVEAGWRVSGVFRGLGYATEGAREALRFAFEDLDRQEVLARATLANGRSRRLMEKLGMVEGEAFDAPRRTPDNRPRRQVLYRLTRDDWRSASPPA